MVWVNRQHGYTPIGLDIQGPAVHAVQFVQHGGTCALHAADSQPIEPSDESDSGRAAVLDALATLLRAGSFVGKRAISVLPSEAVDIRPIRLPKGVGPEDGARFHEALRMEARSCLLYDPQNAVVDYMPLPETAPRDSEEGLALLLVAVRRETAHQHLALLKAAGLTCLHLDIRPCAAMRVVPASEAPVALIELEESRTCISVVVGGKLAFSRGLKSGWRSLVDVLVSEFDTDMDSVGAMLTTYGVNQQGKASVDLARAEESGMVARETIPAVLFETCVVALDQFAQEVRRTFEYFQMQPGGRPVEKAYLFGNMLVSNMEGYLADRLSLPVLRWNAHSAASARSTVEDLNDPALVVAAGLALRGQRL